MLKLYYIKNDDRQYAMEELINAEYRCHYIGSDGIVVQYTDENELKHIMMILKEICDIDYVEELEDITVEQVELLSRMPFNYIDMDKFKKYFNLENK